MLKLVTENRFKKDVKRLRKRGKDLTKLNVVIQTLLKGQSLPPRYRDHTLTGNWAGYRDCHIEPDWLLFYKVTKTQLILARSGSHADLT